LPLFLGPVPDDGLPKDAKPGCTLTGSLKIAFTSPLAGDKRAPCGYPILFTVPPPAKKDSEDEKDDVPEEKDPVAKMRKAQREAQVRTATHHTRGSVLLL
jgi:tripeptidyl-peptidase II